VELDIFALTAAAAVTGLVHTLLGPDHYLPFISMARARGWSLSRTLAITGACGVGHVVGSVGLGVVGILFGVALFEVEDVESTRGQIAGWLLLAFGIAYFAWGLHRAIRDRPHRHVHVHEDGVAHSHPHTHAAEHAHVHDHGPASRQSVTPWVLFIIFVLGPCEPLIPLFMYPAATGGVLEVGLVTAAFTAATLVTMLGVVTALYLGSRALRLGRFERYAHALGGVVIIACGIAVTAGL
jgi:ABC-type nickel/cobalt efflux system permease component RcnA